MQNGCFEFISSYFISMLTLERDIVYQLNSLKCRHSEDCCQYLAEGIGLCIIHNNHIVAVRKLYRYTGTVF